MRPKTSPSFYDSSLSLSSVVIVFHNEGWTPLVRTVHSVVNRTPNQLLKEVVMFDDFSDKPHLGQKLEVAGVDMCGSILSAYMRSEMKLLVS